MSAVTEDAIRIGEQLARAKDGEDLVREMDKCLSVSYPAESPGKPMTTVFRLNNRGAAHERGARLIERVRRFCKPEQPT